MASDKSKNSISNMAWGLIPWLSFVIALNLIPYKEALIIGVVSWALLLVFFSYIKKDLTLVILINISAGALAVQSLSLFLPIRHEYTTVFCEIILILFFWIFNRYNKQIKRYYLIREALYNKNSKSVALNELFFVARIYLDVLFIHLTIVFIYSLVPEDHHYKGLDNFIYNQMGVIFLFLVIIYEHIRLSLIKKKLSGEDWLPVVNESGRVIGKVAKSVSFKSGNQFLHPVARVALIYKGLLYLMERPSNYLVDPDKVDHPFEEYPRYSEELDHTIKNIILQRSGAEDMQTRFVFKYLYKNERTNRLIYLYILPIHDDETMGKMRLKGGKIWTEKQIEENLGKGIFSECLEKEYEILKNTILMAEKLVVKA